MKKVSLILTTFNCAENLERTLKSIESQDFKNLEIIIKDGKSTDDTLEIIKKYQEDSQNDVKWVSSDDKGIYDAMNQGYSLSTGDIIAFFNDIFLMKNAITLLVSSIEENTNCVGAHADLIYATDEKVVRYWKMGRQKSIYLGWMPGHPTLYLKREIYEKYGLYNPEYKCSADYEFMIRFLKDKNNKLAYVPETIIRMFYGGTSTASTESYLISLKEGHKALKDNNIHMAWVTDIFRTCRVFSQFRSTNYFKTLLNNLSGDRL